MDKTITVFDLFNMLEDELVKIGDPNKFGQTVIKRIISEYFFLDKKEWERKEDQYIKRIK